MPPYIKKQVDLFEERFNYSDTDSEQETCVLFIDDTSKEVKDFLSSSLTSLLEEILGAMGEEEDLHQPDSEEQISFGKTQQRIGRNEYRTTLLAKLKEKGIV